MKTVEGIATRLIMLCEQREFVKAYNKLFADDALSVDPVYKDEVLKGLTHLIDRETRFLSAVELHSVKLSKPIIAGSYFTVGCYMSFTPTDTERRMVEELAIYQIKNGKIISQQFFIG